MTLHRFPARTSVTVLFACVGAAWLSAAKPPKQATTVPATASFRCDYPLDTTSPCGAENLEVDKVDPVADHIVHDGVGASPLNGTLGARFFLRVTGTGSKIRLFLPGALTNSPSRDECATEGVLAACNPDDSLTSLDGKGIDLTDAEVSIALLNPPNFEEIPGGLVAMGCGAPGLALVHYTAWLPSGNGHWGLNFNPRPLYHSTGAVVTRMGNRTWVVEAFPATETENYAELVSFNHSGIRRKAGPSHEGRYSVRFQLTIRVDGTAALPSGSTTPCGSN